jgi:dGTP triphosphohydrolase
MDEPTLAVMHELRDFMFANVYMAPAQVERQQRRDRPSSGRSSTTTSPIPTSCRRRSARQPTSRSSQVVDYVAGMTDRFALSYREVLGRYRDRRDRRDRARRA